MVKIARDKVPEADFIRRYEESEHLENKFDAVTCIFSAIHYNRNTNELNETLTNFYNQLKPGGILIFDLSFNHENWIEGLVSVDTVVEDRI